MLLYKLSRQGLEDWYSAYRVINELIKLGDGPVDLNKVTTSAVNPALALQANDLHEEALNIMSNEHAPLLVAPMSEAIANVWFAVLQALATLDASYLCWRTNEHRQRTLPGAAKRVGGRFGAQAAEAEAQAPEKAADAAAESQVAQQAKTGTARAPTPLGELEPNMDAME